MIQGADVFLGLSAAGVLKADMLAGMAEKPLVMALANPDPEIMPEEARAARPDAMVCTAGPTIPTRSTMSSASPTSSAARSMRCDRDQRRDEVAAVRAIAGLAREEPSDVAARAYSGETPIFVPTI